MCIRDSAHTVGNGIEKLPYKLGIQFSDPVYCKVTVKVQIGSATQIYRTENKCFIHGKNAGAIPADSCLIAKSLFDHRTDYNTSVFYGMVSVYLQIDVYKRQYLGTCMVLVA